jgi:23S rRNA (cytosine1962-C5)-methyltransferase
MPDYPIVRLKIRRNVDYPLVWRRMVAEDPAAAPGDAVGVIDKHGAFVGHGFFSPTSQIAVRILSTDPGEELDEAFFRRRLGTAISFRRDALGFEATPTSAFRVCNAEGDGLSGLIVDRYADLIVAEIHSIGFYRRRDLLGAILAEAFPGARVYWSADREIQEKEDFVLEESPPTPVRIDEHGISYLIDCAVGHKTGFFLDQRDNRLRLRSIAAGKSVLDACCFTGGFALNAARAGARDVIGIDLDEKAIELAAKNAAHNKLKASFVHVDAFAYLRDMARTGKTVDLAILDPAKLARTLDDVPDALRTHFDFHRVALPVLRPGGILVSCSCSGLVSEEAFLTTLKNAGRRAGREIRVFGLTGPSPDHPYSLNFPEGRYLKVIWARVS